LQWGTYYGGGAADEVYGVATDGNGNVFIVGSTYSNNGISSPGAHTKRVVPAPLMPLWPNSRPIFLNLGCIRKALG
jgi:hypothetical protein